MAIYFNGQKIKDRATSGLIFTTSSGVAYSIKKVYYNNQLVYNLQSYDPSQVLYELANPSNTITSDPIPIYQPGVYEISLVGGGNTNTWCYIGCYYAGSAAGFIGKMYFNTKCYLRIITGGEDGASILQVASWNDPNTWYNLITCNAGNNAVAWSGNGSGGAISVNRSSTFNNYFDVSLETKGNTGRNGSGEGYGYSVWNGYGSGGTKGYSKLEYIRENQ